MKKHKHSWTYEARAERTELWKVCQLCGAEKQLKVVSVEPLKHSSKHRKKRMGSSTLRRRIDKLFEDTS
jgi:hypothetical protein